MSNKCIICWIEVTCMVMFEFEHAAALPDSLSRHHALHRRKNAINCTSCELNEIQGQFSDSTLSEEKRSSRMETTRAHIRTPWMLWPDLSIIIRLRHGYNSYFKGVKFTRMPVHVASQSATAFIWCPMIFRCFFFIFVARLVANVSVGHAIAIIPFYFQCTYITKCMSIMHTACR